MLLLLFEVEGGGVDGDDFVHVLRAVEPRPFRADRCLGLAHHKRKAVDEEHQVEAPVVVPQDEEPGYAVARLLVRRTGAPLGFVELSISGATISRSGTVSAEEVTARRRPAGIPTMMHVGDGTRDTSRPG